MDPKINFLVPPYVHKLAAEISQYSGVVDGVQPDDVIETAGLLRERVGKLVEVTFALPVDPLDFPFDAVEAVAKATDGGIYIYCVDAFTEPSRGVRVNGRVVFRETGEERRLEIPWKHGEPGLDVATLVAGGLDAADATGLVARFHRD